MVGFVLGFLTAVVIIPVGMYLLYAANYNK